jgi:hypothetical protein
VHELEQLYNLNMPAIDKESIMDIPFLNYPCRHEKYKGVMDEIVNGDKDYISLLYKFYSHSDYELALLSNNGVIQSAITDLPHGSSRTMFELAYQLIQFLSSQYTIDRYGTEEGYPYIVYNYDEYTTDRGSGMSLKGFHLHLNFWKKETIRRIMPIHTKDISAIKLKELVDPLFAFARELLSDVLDHKKYDEYITPAGNVILNYAQVYHVKKGWDFIKTPNFSALLADVHLGLNQAYINILEAFTGKTTPPPHGSRHALLEQEQIEKNIDELCLSDQVKSGLCNLSKHMKNISSEQITWLQNKPQLLNSVLSLRWLAYSIGLFSHSYIEADKLFQNQPLYMNVALRLFSKIGGASIMNFPDHDYVNIVRNTGNISIDDFANRIDFLRDFLKCIKEESL